jgi:hypothetical protein
VRYETWQGATTESVALAVRKRQTSQPQRH